jgi:hypothetical protein
VKRRQAITLVAGALGALPGGLLSRVSLAQSQSAPPSGAPVNVLEFEPLARQRLPREVWEYISQGAADELTLRRNREAFDAIRLRPRVLVDAVSTPGSSSSARSSTSRSCWRRSPDKGGCTRAPSPRPRAAPALPGPRS